MVVAFTAISVLAHVQARFFFDLPITSFLQALRNPVLDLMMRGMSWPGYPPQWLLMFGLVAGCLLLAGWKFEALIMGVAELGVGAMGFLLKPLVDRPRPPDSLVWVNQHLHDPYTYTAGHVHTGMVMFGWLVWLLLTRVPRESKYRRFLVPFSIVFLVLTGISRIYLGEHWTSDVLAAYLLGGIWLELEILAYRYWPRLRERAASVTDTIASHAA
jgi:undecaprenyl-diphosphatase